MEPAAAWTVTAFMYSGKPDPVWALNEEQVNTWMDAWEDAAHTGGIVEIPSILGYRGCCLQKNKHSYWLLHNNCVCLYENNLSVCKKDVNRKMELFLLGTSPEPVQQILHQLHVI